MEKRTKVYLFKKEVNKGNFEDGTVEVLFKDKREWIVKSGFIKKKGEKLVFYYKDFLEEKEMDIVIMSWNDSEEKNKGTFDFCLGGYAKRKGEKLVVTKTFPEIVVAYWNGYKYFTIIGFGTEIILCTCLRPFPAIFENLESITPSGFNFNGKSWTISKKYVMRAAKLNNI